MESNVAPAATFDDIRVTSVARKTSVVRFGPVAGGALLGTCVPHADKTTSAAANQDRDVFIVTAALSAVADLFASQR
jgi:hypothetical protein